MIDIEDPFLMKMQVAPTAQLGKKNGRRDTYTQAREFDADGKPIRDIDFTDHGYPKSHTNPHQHRWLENSTGGTPNRGAAEPLQGFSFI